jgi:uncharacterized protein GlcG (DUF336 family)
MPTQTWSLTEGDIRAIVEAGVARASELKIAVTVAVVEAGGSTVGLLRMDGAKMPSTQAAPAKAWTSAFFGRPSGDYARTTAPGGDAFGLWNVFPGRLAPVAGGRPLLVSGAVVGGVGISGGSSEQDDLVAQAAVAVFESLAGGSE